MAIQALPEHTIHLLSSSQILTTALSLVKELIDNALDAKATAIDILISQNTIDKVEVRDNGQGIGNEDLDALGRRGHTSKIRSLEELKVVGGSSLGFRGEALFSTVQLGKVSVTTRTDGEPVATTVKLKGLGGIDSQSRASHPIGTTVSVLNFMVMLPVRKQNALKEAPKTLANIRNMIQAYAIARQTVRFSLKVIKETKGAWTYAPHPKGSLRDAISQVVGRESALQCIEKTVKFWAPRDTRPPLSAENSLADVDDGSIHVRRSDQSMYIVNAFLPKPDAQYTKIAQDKFISVDSRPLSSDKGTPKRILNLFKRYTKNLFSQSSGERIKSPFLYLSITCPSATYDPNVEPAKDDVIFVHEELLLESIEALFRSIYGDYEQRKLSTSFSSSEKLKAFDFLLAPKIGQEEASREPLTTTPDISNWETAKPATTLREEELSPSALEEDHPGIIEADDSVQNTLGESYSEGQRIWGFNMSSNITEDGDNNHSSETSLLASKRQKSLPPSSIQPAYHSTVNPWILAKMKARVREHQDLRSTANADVSNPVPSPGTLGRGSPRLMTPVSPCVQSRIQPNSIERAEPIPRDLIDTRCGNQRSGWPISKSPIEPDENNMTLVDSEPQRPRRDFVSARNIAAQVMISPPATQYFKGLDKARGSNRPFISPLRPPVEGSLPNQMHQTRLAVDERGTHNQVRNDKHIGKQNAELVWAMDFERRKEAATRLRRSQRRGAGTDLNDNTTPLARATRSFPHKARYETAVASLQRPENQSHEQNALVKAPEQPYTSLPHGDPRAYLVRRLKSMQDSSTRLKRSQTMMLPLETIQVESQLHALLQTLQVDASGIRTSMKALAEFDSYTYRGSKTLLDLSPTDISSMEKKLQATVNLWLLRLENDKCEVDYSFGTLSKAKNGNSQR